MGMGMGNLKTANAATTTSNGGITQIPKVIISRTNSHDRDPPAGDRTPPADYTTTANIEAQIAASQASGSSGALAMIKSAMVEHQYN